MSRNKLLIICGPTATGKTKLAIALAKQCNGELVSADSRQVYKGGDILTGKGLPKNTKYPFDKAQGRQISNIKYRFRRREYRLPIYSIDGIPLWLYDVVESNEPFSVALYQQLARAVIADIQKRGKLPMLVGGTGLYIRAVTRPIETASVPQNPTLRAELGNQSLAELAARLQSDDPEKWIRMNQSDRQNPRRLVRAIEVGAWYGHHRWGAKEQAPSYDTLWIGLTGSRKTLRRVIEQHVRERFAQGVVDEVKRLGDSLDKRTLPAATSLGLATVRRYIAGDIDREEAIRLWSAQEYDYAKRQMTWFGKEQVIRWFDITEKQYKGDVALIVQAWYTGHTDDVKN